MDRGGTLLHFARAAPTPPLPTPVHFSLKGGAVHMDGALQRRWVVFPEFFDVLSSRTDVVTVQVGVTIRF